MKPTKNPATAAGRGRPKRMKNSPPPNAATGSPEKFRKAGVLFLAVLCFIAPLKFTQLIVLDFTPWPSGLLKWVTFLWPNPLFFMVALPLALIFLAAGKKLSRDLWIWPILFLVVQILAFLDTVDTRLSQSTLLLFLSLVLAYWLGARLIRDELDLEGITFAWLAGCVFVLASGHHQITGGLEDVRRFIQEYPDIARHVPSIEIAALSGRIYATFISPNALGGYLGSTIFIVACWFLKSLRWPESKKNPGSSPRPGFDRIRLWATVAAIFGILYCFWFAGSRGSYISLYLTLAVAIQILARHRGFLRLLQLINLLVFVLGIALGFGRQVPIKKFGNLPATYEASWKARLGYWKAAVKITRKHPVLGTGPGTFAKLHSAYQENPHLPTRLVHNNYLQMACDSGLLGFAAFIMWLPWSMWRSLQRWRNRPLQDRLTPTLLWCACLVFTIHSLVDFDLYMISNAWPIFMLLGYLSSWEAPEGS